VDVAHFAGDLSIFSDAAVSQLLRPSDC
jgi:hypothetical protein